MTELNENKTNEQNKNENEPKKKRSKITILLVIILVGVVVYAGYSIAKPYIQQYIGKQGNAALESLKVGETYTYSEEQKEEFRQKATELMEKQVAEKDLKPGESYYIKDSWDEYKKGAIEAGVELFAEDPNDESLITGEEDALINELMGAYSFSNAGYTSFKYDSHTLEAGNLFNEDLSLKEPDLFYGYTGVGETSKAVLNDYKLNEGKDDSLKYSLTALNHLEDKFLNSKDGELYNYLDDIYRHGADMASYGQGKYYSNENANNLEKCLVGADFLAVKAWLDASGSSYIKTLSSYLNFKMGFGIPGYYSYNTIMSDYNGSLKYSKANFNPKEYNAYLENENYFVTYVPSAISKVGEHTYIIDLEVDKPVDTLALAIIKNNMMANIKNHWDEEINLEDVKLDVMVRIVNKGTPNLNKNINFGVFDIMMDTEYITNINGDTISSDYYTIKTWFPNEEAIVWIEDYFSQINDAIENNKKLSVFDTIEDIADNYDVPVDDVVSVIFSCYYQ